MKYCARGLRAHRGRQMIYREQTPTTEVVSRTQIGQLLQGTHSETRAEIVAKVTAKKGTRRST